MAAPRLTDRTTNELIEAIDLLMAFRREQSKGIDGAYYGYVYGHPEPNEECEKDWQKVRDQFRSAIIAMTGFPV